jgi:membrane protein implicated in regulation of membrane protease activity
MLPLISSLGHWIWFVAAVVLFTLEVLAPGAFMLWLGLAAAVVGAISLGVAWTWQMQCLAFVVLSAAAFPLWRRLGRRPPPPTDQPFLNRRGEVLVGRLLTLDKPIVGGAGTVRVDDTIWRVSGPDTPAGARVRVARTDGSMLIVEAA